MEREDKKYEQLYCAALIVFQIDSQSICAHLEMTHDVVNLT